MKATILFLLIIPLTTMMAKSQGCVAIRNVAGISPDLLFDNVKPGDKFIFNITNRYFEATKSFKGDKSFSDTLVTNKIFTVNISVSRIFEHGWMISLVYR